MALVEIGITGNAGYSTNQVRKMSVSELISELENFDSEDEVYLKDAGNRYGAAYGEINYIEQGLSEDYEDDDDEDEYYESNLYSQIKSNLKEADKLIGFENFTPEEYGYSEANTHAVELLKSAKEYFKTLFDLAESDPYAFQGIENIGALSRVPALIEEAIKKYYESCGEDLEEEE